MAKKRRRRKKKKKEKKMWWFWCRTKTLMLNVIGCDYDLTDCDRLFSRDKGSEWMNELKFTDIRCGASAWQILPALTNLACSLAPNDTQCKYVNSRKSLILRRGATTALLIGDDVCHWQGGKLRRYGHYFKFDCLLVFFSFFLFLFVSVISQCFSPGESFFIFL